MAPLPRRKAPKSVVLEPSEDNAPRVVLGEVVGVHGIRGDIKIHSSTRPRTNIFDYSVWGLEVGEVRHDYVVLQGRQQGKNLVARLKGVTDRDAAFALRGHTISVPQSALPAKAPGEYYWRELIGLRVETQDGVALGQVSDLLETGANDVLVVAGERERLIPYLPEQTVQSVDLDQGLIEVDWDPDF